MKKQILLLVLSVFLSETLSAQFTDGDLSIGGGTVTGPVKKVTVTITQTHDPSDVLTTTAYFDTMGRITKTGVLRGEKEEIDGIYRYRDNSCVHYHYYSDDGKADDHFEKIFFDAEGREIMKFFYWQTTLTGVDSLVYDTQGHLIAKYTSNYGERTPLLEKTYAYDSMDRIVEENNVKTGERYTISYMPDGNYTKQITKSNGKKVTAIGTVNEAGQLVEEVIAKESKTRYLEYDKHGNWLKREGSMNSNSLWGRIGSVTERIIEYYGDIL